MRWHDILRVINKHVYYKIGLVGFWRPTNQNFDFRPFIFPLKKDEERPAWRLEPTAAKIVTVFTAHWPSRQFYFKNYGDFLLYNTNYALMVESYARLLFFCVFFTKNKKARPREKWCGFFILFILL